MVFDEINPIPLGLALGQADTGLATAAFVEGKDKPWICSKRKALYVASVSQAVCRHLHHTEVFTTQRFL